MTAGGQILTFYSYKGGTGRTMALANVAWILASRGKRVLAIDWDLEAPGLHRYFAPFLADPSLSESDGLIEFLSRYVVTATKDAPPGLESDKLWYESYADIKRYAEPLRWRFADGGSIDFVGAGRQNASYGARVNVFDYEGFYRRFGGGAFLDAAIRIMRSAYDYILVDSRTGISDVSGICTIHMPDALVVFYTLNNQSIEGASSVARHVATTRARSDTEPFPVFSVATRIELSEKVKLESRRVLARERFGDFVDDLPERTRKDYFSEMEVLYDPYYAYEETLATIADTPGLRNSVLAAFERLTDRLTNGAVSRLGEMSDSKRDEALALYDKLAPASTTGQQVVTRRSQTWDVFLSAPSSELRTAQRLFDLLSSNYKVFYASRSVLAGSAIEPTVKEAIEKARVMVVLFGNERVPQGDPVQFELATSSERLTRDPSFKVIPVKLAPDAPSPARFLDQYAALVPADGDIQNVVPQLRQLLGAGTESGERERGLRLKGELDQALVEKAHLAERLAQSENDARKLSEQRAQLSTELNARNRGWVARARWASALVVALLIGTAYVAWSASERSSTIATTQAALQQQLQLQLGEYQRSLAELETLRNALANRQADLKEMQKVGVASDRTNELTELASRLVLIDDSRKKAESALRMTETELKTEQSKQQQLSTQSLIAFNELQATIENLEERLRRSDEMLAERDKTIRELRDSPKPESIWSGTILPSVQVLQKSSITLTPPPFRGELAVVIGNVDDDGTNLYVYRPRDVTLKRFDDSDLEKDLRGQCVSSGKVALKKEPKTLLFTYDTLLFELKVVGLNSILGANYIVFDVNAIGRANRPNERMSPFCQAGASGSK